MLFPHIANSSTSWGVKSMQLVESVLLYIRDEGNKRYRYKSGTDTAQTVVLSLSVESLSFDYLIKSGTVCFLPK